MLQPTQEEEKRRLDFHIKHVSEISYSEWKTIALLQSTIAAPNRNAEIMTVFKHSDKQEPDKSSHHKLTPLFESILPCQATHTKRFQLCLMQLVE